jgi:hypothetical protein
LAFRIRGCSSVPLGSDASTPSTLCQTKPDCESQEEKRVKNVKEKREKNGKKRMHRNDVLFYPEKGMILIVLLS